MWSGGIQQCGIVDFNGRRRHHVAEANVDLDRDARAGDLDAAEQAAHDLLARFPDVHDGYDRLGMVCEARGDHRQAADCYRKAITIIRDHPENYDPGFEAIFQKLVDRLETQADAAAPIR